MSFSKAKTAVRRPSAEFVFDWVLRECLSLMALSIHGWKITLPIKVCKLILVTDFKFPYWPILYCSRCCFSTISIVYPSDFSNARPVELHKHMVDVLIRPQFSQSVLFDKLHKINFLLSPTFTLINLNIVRALYPFLVSLTLSGHSFTSIVPEQNSSTNQASQIAPIHGGQLTFPSAIYDCLAYLCQSVDGGSSVVGKLSLFLPTIICSVTLLC